MPFHHARHEEKPRGVDHLTSQLRHLTGDPGHRPHAVVLDEHIAVKRRAAARVPNARTDDHGFAHSQPPSSNPIIRLAYVTIDPERGVCSAMTWVA
jgi:hypothetical protein